MRHTDFFVLLMGLLAIVGSILQLTMPARIVRWNREFSRSVCPLSLRTKVSTVRTFGKIGLALGLIIVGLAIWAPWNATR